MNIGFLFPGQGSQAIGMGKDLYDNFDEVKDTYNKVKEITGIDIAKISFEGPEEKLNTTSMTQLAILTMSLGILKILEKNNIKATISCGLSLGEYAALIYSKLLTEEDGIKLIQKRGQYMQELCPKGKWKMAAILGLDDDQVEQICSKVTDGFVVPANYNCKGQVVISGDEDAIYDAQEMANLVGARKVMVLNTAGPFHTSKLSASSKALKKDLAEVNFGTFETKVVKNLDGKVYSQEDDFKSILADHIINPVRFTTSVQTMLAEGVDTFIEIGPGKALSGFVKRAETDKQINIMNICDTASLEKVINFVNENK